ncbi:Hypothetical predicted protein [Paramuricea clavata]|uniref:Uncharacterized protein n=1 Tax=Paramuricea clavata TaxID=317549 RepID=A0A7D9I5P2_PARCT|nr:Hypothetical predicted protein [Paramuricea clavata]
MTGVLSMTAEPKDATMFGKRVAVLTDSEEVQIAMRESAYVVGRYKYILNQRCH